MPSDVYLARISNGDKTENVQESVRALWIRAGMASCIRENDIVAVKLHFGEIGGTTFIPPAYVKTVVDMIKEAGGQPFLTDTNTLYRGQRENAVKHINTAYEHGFTPDAVGAPVIIADGPIGTSEVKVPINGKYYRNVGVAEGVVSANAMIVVTHATGHPQTGFAGAIKNMGMGLSSRKGKLEQHSKSRPTVKADVCVGCGLCIEMCPVDVISRRDEKAWIDEEKCIGCGECLAVCRVGAVKFSWDQGGEDMQQRIAEHALGAVKGKKGKVGYLTFLMSMTEGCDCFGKSMEPIVPDVGVIAGFDPVAIDSAGSDLARDDAGRTLAELAAPGADPNPQMDHGAEIGLGTREYTLIEV